MKIKFVLSAEGRRPLIRATVRSWGNSLAIWAPLPLVLRLESVRLTAKAY